jgi:hypothetical protein
MMLKRALTWCHAKVGQQAPHTTSSQSQSNSGSRQLDRRSSHPSPKPTSCLRGFDTCYRVHRYVNLEHPNLSTMPSPAVKKKLGSKNDLGAGLKITQQSIDNHPAGPPRHGELSQAERAFTLASTFLSGVLA